LARASTSEFEKIGTGMSVSSGVFSFPSTGKWLVRWQIIHSAASVSDYGSFYTQVSVDSGSSFTTRAAVLGGNTTAIRYSTSFSECLVDVTSTSTVKVRFVVGQAAANNQIYSGSGANYCAMTFVRIGDT
jgi:type 1 fimbria pilin